MFPYPIEKPSTCRFPQDAGDTSANFQNYGEEPVDIHPDPLLIKEHTFNKEHTLKIYEQDL